MPKMLKEKIDELNAKMLKAKTTIEKTQFSLDKKKLTADVALGTSLANYADPKIIYSWCKEMNLNINKIFSKAQITKFGFAENVDENFWRNYP
jgi:hypothetical protein